MFSAFFAVRVSAVHHLLSPFFLVFTSIKIDTFLTLSKSRNRLPSNYFDGHPLANFDTSSISRGLCDRTAGPKKKKDYEKTDDHSDSGDYGDAPHHPALRLPGPHLQRPEWRALLAQFAGRNHKYLVVNRRVRHQRSSSSRAARLHERFHPGARDGN